MPTSLHTVVPWHESCTDDGVDSTAVPPAPSDEAPQRIVKVRRDYNSWVARETMEDYALRFTPQRFRKMVGVARRQHRVRRAPRS